MCLNLPWLIGFGATFAPIILSTFCSLTSFAPRLLTHFVHSLRFRSLISFIHSWHSLRSCFCCSLHSLLACSLTSFVRCTFAHSLHSFALGASFARAFVAHFVCSSLAHSLRSFTALSLTHFVRSLVLLSLTLFTPRLLTHFVRSLRFAALRSCISLHSIQSLGRRLSIKKPNCLHYHFLQFAHTIAISILPE